MIWSYGVTCVPERFTTTLPITLNSLKNAGFPEPRLFVDGVGAIPAEYQHLEITQHVPRLRTFGNWITAAWELYIREPLADRYALFQDDFITYHHLRDYLEKCPYPEDGYLNLYTFPVNSRSTQGWHRSNQRGMGAVALVFNNKVFRTLLSEPNHIVDRPWKGCSVNSRREWTAVDGAIVDAMRKSNLYEYCHTPSLTQHIGTTSSMDNPPHDRAQDFRTESFDARQLLESLSLSGNSAMSVIPSKPVPNPSQVDSKAPSVDSKGLSQQGASTEPINAKNATGSVLEASRRYNPIGGIRKRIGLVGYSCRSGLGELNRQIATYCDIDTWLIKTHQKYPTVPPPEHIDAFYCDSNSLSLMETFVSSIDVLVMCETCYYRDLLILAKRAGKKIVWVPMQEWAPENLNGWPRDVDLTLCPTKDCYDQFKDLIECLHVPWPVDTNRFEFRQRSKVEKFVFINGHGGIHGRKGADVVRRAKELWPEMPLIVHSQHPIPGLTDAAVKDYMLNSSVYKEGDILINPSKVDGLGLQRLEALACGMPVISTDAAPWIESPTIGRIECDVTTKRLGRTVNWYEPKPESLVRICQELLGEDITLESQEVRKWAEENSWEKRAEYISNLIRSVV